MVKMVVYKNVIYNWKFNGKIACGYHHILGLRQSIETFFLFLVSNRQTHLAIVSIFSIVTLLLLLSSITIIIIIGLVCLVDATIQQTCVCVSV